jgi:hypothetical protein
MNAQAQSVKQVLASEVDGLPVLVMSDTGPRDNRFHDDALLTVPPGPPFSAFSFAHKEQAPRVPTALISEESESSGVPPRRVAGRVSLRRAHSAHIGIRGARRFAFRRQLHTSATTAVIDHACGLRRA